MADLIRPQIELVRPRAGRQLSASRRFSPVDSGIDNESTIARASWSWTSNRSSIVACTVFDHSIVPDAASISCAVTRT